MKFDINLFSIKPVIKLINQGKVDRAFEKIYDTAESLAINDTKHYQNRVQTEFMANKNEGNLLKDYALKILKYREKRLEFYMEKMLELLKITLNKK